MSDSIGEHLGQSDSVKKIIDNSNVLLTRAKDELQTAREVLTALREYQHPKVAINHRTAPYQVKTVADCPDRDFTPAHLIDKQIARISALLGDRP